MAKKSTAPPDPRLIGDYYGQHDGCLYRISYANGSLWQARCTAPAEDPAADVFGEPYQTSTTQLRHLLGFGCFIPAT